MSKDPHLY